MKYYELNKFCKKVNTDPIYLEYSRGIRCYCFRNTHGVITIQVIHFDYHKSIQSQNCNDWEEDYTLEWIINATKTLKENLCLCDISV